MESIVVGFGTTELEFAHNEENALREYAEELFREHNDRGKMEYFTKEFINEIENWVGKRRIENYNLCKHYDKAEEYPERYSRFWCIVTQSASDIVVIYNFLHTNRRHSFSPDGWAVMSGEHMVHLSLIELEENYRENK